MSRSAIGSAAVASVGDIRTATTETIAKRDMNPPSFFSLSPLAGRGNPCILVLRIPGRFPSRDPPEHATDGHADAGRVALAEHVAGHDLAGGEHIGGGL